MRVAWVISFLFELRIVLHREPVSDDWLNFNCVLHHGFLECPRCEAFFGTTIGSAFFSRWDRWGVWAVDLISPRITHV